MQIIVQTFMVPKEKDDLPPTFHACMCVCRYSKWICTSPMYNAPPSWGIRAPSVPSSWPWTSELSQTQPVIHLLWDQVETGGCRLHVIDVFHSGHVEVSCTLSLAGWIVQVYTGGGKILTLFDDNVLGANLRRRLMINYLLQWSS